MKMGIRRASIAQNVGRASRTLMGVSSGLRVSEVIDIAHVVGRDGCWS